LECETHAIRREMNLYAHEYQKLETLLQKEKQIASDMESLIHKLDALETEHQKTLNEMEGLSC